MKVPFEYLGDEYPRDGCSIVVKIAAGNFVIEMRAPAVELPIEIYGCRDAAAMLSVVGCLASGRPVPKGYNKSSELAAASHREVV